MAPRCLQPFMLASFHGGHNNKNKNNNNNNRRRRSFRVRPRLPVAAFAALLLANSLWVGGQDWLSNSGGTLGSGKDNNDSNNNDNNSDDNNKHDNNSKKIAGWKQDAGFKYRVGRAPMRRTAGSICFHGLQHWPACASKARSRLVGRGSPHLHSSERQPPSRSVQRFAEDPLKKLTRELSSATSAQAVLSVLEQEDMNKLSEVHIAAAFTRLAKYKREFAVRESPVLHKLTAKLQKMLDTGNYLGARQCANVFWSIASLQTAVPKLKELLPMLIENAKVTAPDMNTLDVTNIVVACTKTRLSSNELTGLLQPILERLVDRADFLNPQQIANCIWASAKLKADAPEILEVMPVLVEMAEEKLANMIWSGATLRGQAPELLGLIPKLVGVAFNQTATFQAQELSNIIWSMATLREEVPELQELLPALLKALPKRLGTLEEQHIANVVWSLGVLQAGDLAGDDVLGSLASKGTSIIRKFTPQALANTAWGFALCGFKDVQFMSAAASLIVASVPTMRSKALSLSLPQISCAFSKLSISNSALLASTAKHLPPVLRNSADWTICALAWSYNKLDPQRDFADFQDKLAKEMGRRKLSPQDVERSQLGPHEWRKRPERRQSS
ncbi:unnamed protein product [Polarella glacialis]|uniref:RNA-editing substrate-binding complex 6 protein domain-containing protein n=1 Tax=Polarella glacialis TaxID=89957 RepID=A0A813F2P0_POLGL|nr:unnamed protein product [Polarella glacialis]